MNVYITEIRVANNAPELPEKFRGREGIIGESVKFNGKGIKQALLDTGDVAYLKPGEYRVLSRKAVAA